MGYGYTCYTDGWSLEKYSQIHKRSIQAIKTEQGRESMCLAYALVLGIAHADQNKNEFNFLKYPLNQDSFTEKAIELCNNAKVDLSYGGGIEELKQFQTFFGNNYNIIVYTNRKGRSLLFEGNGVDDIKKIFLFLEDQHYLLITSVHSAFNLKYYWGYDILSCLLSFVFWLTMLQQTCEK